MKGRQHLFSAMNRKVLRTLIVVAAIVVVFHFSLFSGLRECAFATDYDEYGVARSTIRLCYFSENRTANATLFYFFFPIHACMGHPIFSDTLTQKAFDAYDGRPYYIYDRSALWID